MEMEKNYYVAKNMKLIKGNTSHGSITVEAAFVMPIVILTIFALIYLAFYLHDTCRIQSVTDMALLKASFSVKHEADIATGKVSYKNINDRGVFYLLLGNTEDEEKQITNYLRQELSKGLFLVKINSVNAEVGKLKLKVSVEADTQVSLPGIEYLFKQYSKTKVEGEYPVHNPAETIRCTEVILETGSNIKGIDELKDKIKKIFGK